MILPPAHYYVNNKCYETCTGQADYTICTKHVKSKCLIPNVQNCTKTMVTENFYLETSRVILLGIVYPIKIKDQEIRASSILMTDEPIVIEGTQYTKKTVQDISIPEVVPMQLTPEHKIQIEKLKIPETHGQLQPIEPIEALPPLSMGLSTTAIVVILFVSVFLIIILVKKRRRISKIPFGPKLQPAQIQALEELLTEASRTSRTKPGPKEEGEM